MGEIQLIWPCLENKNKNPGEIGFVFMASRLKIRLR